MEPAGPHATSPSEPLRLERRLTARIGRDEHIVAWARAWVGRDGPLHGWFAARTLDFAVLTNKRLYLFSTGFFTRRPRRRVYDMPFDRLWVEDRKTNFGRMIRLAARDHRPLLLQLRATGRHQFFVQELKARTRRDETGSAAS